MSWLAITGIAVGLSYGFLVVVGLCACVAAKGLPSPTHGRADGCRGERPADGREEEHECERVGPDPCPEEPEQGDDGGTDEAGESNHGPLLPHLKLV